MLYRSLGESACHFWHPEEFENVSNPDFENLKHLQNPGYLPLTAANAYQEVPQPWWVLENHHNAPPLYLPIVFEFIQFDKTEIHHHLVSWCKYLITQTPTLSFSVPNYRWVHTTWNNSRLSPYIIYNVTKIENHPCMSQISGPHTWTIRDLPFSPQNYDLTSHITTFHTRGVCLCLDHIGFSSIWEQNHIALHCSWNPWKFKWILFPILEYPPEKIHF